jgi:hypothetical protein
LRTLSREKVYQPCRNQFLNHALSCKEIYPLKPSEVFPSNIYISLMGEIFCFLKPIKFFILFV